MYASLRYVRNRKYMSWLCGESAAMQHSGKSPKGDEHRPQPCALAGGFAQGSPPSRGFSGSSSPSRPQKRNQIRLSERHEISHGSTSVTAQSYQRGLPNNYPPPRNPLLCFPILVVEGAGQAPATLVASLPPITKTYKSPDAMLSSVRLNAAKL